MNTKKIGVTLVCGDAEAVTAYKVFGQLIKGKKKIKDYTVIYIMIFENKM